MQISYQQRWQKVPGNLKKFNYNKKDFQYLKKKNYCFLFYSQSEAEDLVVIREVYDSDNAQEIFELELEKALQVL